MAIQAEIQSKLDKRAPIINDFAFSVATKNGSGSQTSNNVLVKSLFRMGIPVNGKNLFPSNIKGLPTWYTIRASKDGYTARKEITEVVVAYNNETAPEDVLNLPPGGVCITTDKIARIIRQRDDISYYVIPVTKLMRQATVPSAFRKLVENMTYVGAVAQLFDIPLGLIYQVLLDNFKGREKPARMNHDVIKLAYDWTAENILKSDPFRFEHMDGTQGKIMMTGNDAGALGAVFGGVNVVAWYPITPSTSFVDGIIGFRNLRQNDAGENTIAIVQAEDELAAAGIITGAGWAGARALTSTSGPGISLMAEFAGLAYFAEIPTVFWNITRMGPSTGLPTRTSQGDLLFTHFLGHGDSRQICLLPGNLQEAFEFGWRSFDIAEALQSPVFVISDLDLGMNNWLSEPFDYPDQAMDRGKRLDEHTLRSFIDEHGKWGRYMDVDGDGIPYRTVPGTAHPFAAYFARGTGHDEMATYSERSDDWIENMRRLRLKMETARALLPQPIIDDRREADIGIISFGTNDDAIREARDWLENEGIPTNYLRVLALPLAASVSDFIDAHKSIFVIENNFDGQLTQLIRLEHPENISHVRPLALGDGLPMTPSWIYQNLIEQEG
ncbi:MAG: 2-oxoacid:acceptor oxidoreductase subunit alpha [Chloroflexi bacterium]|nr:2-oxoacid:acceptor oxidoreductase subunit alpha [Chloroflexota bacterium]MCY3582006.1 2-oxoacid:acceptor oxidoreductase subunit alpha [Chloroflexota bacterium]MCY3716535.1 2-oxoacid:acceptor oxidoreductase subunit alpha [Chloroflexota bacterium]MDE2651644.1 2-oxoacid:acceptor oxidoreductase subunit alpha [Chloroflexota bacterium]MYA94566.1 2-oxoacid:acceptor oxidoreductase subunit alpha [Chloroflexota bacterium]